MAKITFKSWTQHWISTMSRKGRNPHTPVLDAATAAELKQVWSKYHGAKSRIKYNAPSRTSCADRDPAQIYLFHSKDIPFSMNWRKICDEFYAATGMHATTGSTGSANVIYDYVMLYDYDHMYMHLWLEWTNLVKRTRKLQSTIDKIVAANITESELVAA